MKKITLLILIIHGSCFIANSQKFIGIYEDYFGNKMTISSDSTFYHQYKFDLSSTWYSGKWKENADTLFLENIIIEDTLSYFDSIQNTFKDSMVVSLDEISSRISIEEYLIRFYCTFSQEEKPRVKKLVFKRNKLYTINEHGKLNKKRTYFFAHVKKLPIKYRVYRCLHEKKRPHYYIKITENIHTAPTPK